MSILQVAAHEWRHATRAVDRKSIPLLLAVALLLGFGGPLVLDRGVSPEDGLYPIVVTEDSPFRGVVAADGRLRSEDDGVLRVAERVKLITRDSRGDAAWDALGESTRRYNDQQLGDEMDQAAAFPVTVQWLSEPRELTGPNAPSAGGSQSGAPIQSIRDTDSNVVQDDVRPAQLEPPFPVRSLVLTFAYLIPMNFLAQLQAGSLYAERVRRRGMILLSAPMRPTTILAGRVLPYLAISLAIWLIASIVIGTQGLGWLAALAIVAFVQVAAILVGLLARSERENTFLLTGLTTAFSTFLFLPAVFVSIAPVAYLSPVSVIAAGIRDQAVPMGAFVYATLPLGLMTLALGLVAAAMYREETLFAPRGLFSKASDGLERLLVRKWALFALALLLVPWAFTLELFVVAMAIPLGLSALFILVVLGAAVVEEALKSWLGIRHRRARQTSAWLTGLIVGIGFFLGEKLAFVLVLVQFAQLDQGTQTLQLFGIGTPLQALLPLFIHVGAGILGVTWAHKPKMWRRGAYGMAVVLHGTHNLLAVGGI